jgi:glycosyltransferase involved in cell wall biosynthesis
MKVALVHQPLGTLSVPVQDGSSAIWVYEIARRLARSGEIVVYSRRARNQQESENREGVLYRRVSTRLDDRVFRFFEDHPRLQAMPGLFDRTHPLFASSLAHLEYGLRVAKDIRSQRCDIIHIRNFSQLVPIARAFNPDAKIILHMECEWLTQLDPTMIQARLLNCDSIVACSTYIADKIKRAFPELASRCYVVHNGVDVDAFAPGNQATAETNGAKRLLFVGRVSPEKGLHVLMEAFESVVKRWPEAQLTIVGPEQVPPLDFIINLSDETGVSDLARYYGGSYLTRLRQMLSPKAADRVSFVSILPHADMPNVYRNADLLINPSFVETFGMTLVEAMACKVPVVASRVGGMTEVMENDKQGTFVEPGRPSALAEAILHLLEDERLRHDMGAAGRARVVKYFSWDELSQQMLEVYRNAMVEYGPVQTAASVLH